MKVLELKKTNAKLKETKKKVATLKNQLSKSVSDASFLANPIGISSDLVKAIKAGDAENFSRFFVSKSTPFANFMSSLYPNKDTLKLFILLRDRYKSMTPSSIETSPLPVPNPLDEYGPSPLPTPASNLAFDVSSDLLSEEKKD